jgi:hypothetical protein
MKAYQEEMKAGQQNMEDKIEVTYQKIYVSPEKN